MSQYRRPQSTIEPEYTRSWRGRVTPSRPPTEAGFRTLNYRQSMGDLNHRSYSRFNTVSFDDPPRHYKRYERPVSPEVGRLGSEYRYDNQRRVDPYEDMRANPYEERRADHYEDSRRIEHFDERRTDAYDDRRGDPYEDRYSRLDEQKRYTRLEDQKRYDHYDDPRRLEEPRYEDPKRYTRPYEESEPFEKRPWKTTSASNLSKRYQDSRTVDTGTSMENKPLPTSFREHSSKVEALLQKSPETPKKSVDALSDLELSMSSLTLSNKFALLKEITNELFNLVESEDRDWDMAKQKVLLQLKCIDSLESRIRQ